jgi:hypothetical protein
VIPIIGTIFEHSAPVLAAVAVACRILLSVTPQGNRRAPLPFSEHIQHDSRHN